MKHISDFLEWFIDCFRAIPADIITGLYVSLIFWALGRIINKIRLKSVKLSTLIEKLTSVWSSQPEINDKYTVIPSPKYECGKSKRSGNFLGSSEGAVWFIVIILLAIGARWLQNNYELIQLIFLAFSVIFIILSSLLILVSTFTNRIQSSTLKYIVFSTIVSFYIGYSAVYLPEVIERISEDVALGNTVLFTSISWSGIYAFLGVLYVIIEIGFIVILLLRALTIKMDSIKSGNFTKKMVCLTERWESIKGLILWFIILTSVSYLLTSGILSDWLLGMQVNI